MISASTRLYAIPNNEVIMKALPTPTARTNIARYMANLFMSVEYSQLDDTNKYAYQGTTKAPVGGPIAGKKVWPELRSTSSLTRDVNAVKAIILVERSDITNLTFRYVKAGETYTEPTSTEVIIFTSGTADPTTGLALVSSTHSPILG